MEYNRLVDKGIDNLVKHMWHKIATADEGIERETFLRDICAKTPVVANYGQGQYSGVYIKNSGLPEPSNEESIKAAVNIMFRDYYSVVIVREVINKIVNDIKDVELLKKLLDYLGSKSKCGSLKELLDETDESLEIIRECYLELIKTGTMKKVYLDMVSTNTSRFFHMTSIIDNLHRQLDNSYSSFALIFDTDNSLGFTSKLAINEHIGARTTGYKVYAVCERKVETYPDPIFLGEINTVMLPNWPKSTLTGNYIQAIHDYAIHDYTDDLKEATKQKIK